MSVKTIKNFQSITTTGSTTNIDFATCKDIKATSTETKCTLLSSLNIKSIKDIVITSNPGNYDEFRIDTDYEAPGFIFSHGHSKLIHLEAAGYLSGTSVTYFSSVKLPDINKVEALIPPSSCFNLKLTETVKILNIPFSADGLSGYIEANVIGDNQNEIYPCE